MYSLAATKRWPARSGDVMARRCASTTSRTSTTQKPSAAGRIFPLKSRLTTFPEPSPSVVRMGPKTPLGRTVVNLSVAPSLAMKSHAARSAMTLDCGRR